MAFYNIFLAQAYTIPVNPHQGWGQLKKNWSIQFQNWSRNWNILKMKIVPAYAPRSGETEKIAVGVDLNGHVAKNSGVFQKLH